MNNTNDNKIKKVVNNTFDKVANKYDKNKQFHISATKLVELLDIPKDVKVSILDLSTGTGNIAIKIAQEYPYRGSK